MAPVESLSAVAITSPFSTTWNVNTSSSASARLSMVFVPLNVTEFSALCVFVKPSACAFSLATALSVPSLLTLTVTVTV